MFTPPCEAYEAAKARIWSNLGTTGRAVANATDPVVQRNVPKDAMSDDFGGHGAARVTGEALELDGVELLGLAELHRSLPHDVTNALAAALIASRGGASLDGIQQALRAFRGLEHRVELVAERDGVRWYNDSKATTPHAVVAGVQGFASAVLIAGGRNKGVDLEPLLELAPRLRGVVAIGEAAGEIVSVFEGTVAVETADSMPWPSTGPQRWPDPETLWFSRPPVPRTTGTPAIRNAGRTSPASSASKLGHLHDSSERPHSRS